MQSNMFYFWHFFSHYWWNAILVFCSSATSLWANSRDRAWWYMRRAASQPFAQTMPLWGAWTANLYPEVWTLLLFHTSLMMFTITFFFSSITLEIRQEKFWHIKEKPFFWSPLYKFRGKLYVTIPWSYIP